MNANITALVCTNDAYVRVETIYNYDSYPLNRAYSAASLAENPDHQEVGCIPYSGLTSLMDNTDMANP